MASPPMASQPIARPPQASKSPIANPPLASTPNAIPPMAMAPTDRPPKENNPSAKPPNAKRPRAFPPTANQPTARGPTARMPRASRARPVCGSQPLTTCTSGRPANVRGDLYSKSEAHGPLAQADTSANRGRGASPPAELGWSFEGGGDS